MEIRSQLRITIRPYRQHLAVHLHVITSYTHAGEKLPVTRNLVVTTKTTADPVDLATTLTRLVLAIPDDVHVPIQLPSLIARTIAGENRLDYTARDQYTDDAALSDPSAPPLPTDI